MEMNEILDAVYNLGKKEANAIALIYEDCAAFDQEITTDTVAAINAFVETLDELVAICKDMGLSLEADKIYEKRKTIETRKPLEFYSSVEEDYPDFLPYSDDEFALVSLLEDYLDGKLRQIA